MDQVEASGKTVDDALNTALRQLGCTLNDVEFTVLDEGRRGFLGRGARDAYVRVVRTRPAGTAPATTTQPTGQRGRPRDDARPDRRRGERGERGPARQRPGGPPPAQARRRSAEPSPPQPTAEDFLPRQQTGATTPPRQAPAESRQAPPEGDTRERRPRRAQSNGSRDAEQPIVEPNIDAEEVDVAATMVDDILRLLDIDAGITLREPVTPGDGRGSALAVIDISGDDLGVLIGRRGDTLGSLQYLVNLALLRRYPGTPGITIDIEHYRHRREEQLRTLAERMAERVRDAGSPITLEPMPPSERRLIHLALADDPNVETASIGDGDSRKVVISPRRP